MEVLHISAECYPLAKVGGLADVVGALPAYQNELGLSSSVIMPFYNLDNIRDNKYKTVFEDSMKLGNEQYDFRILTPKENKFNYNIYFVDIPGLLDTNYVYSYEDTDRFLAFQIATLDWIISKSQKPDIVHCHDHHTGLIAFMMSQSYKYSELKDIPTVFTIHNAEYQGWFSHEHVNKIPEFNFTNVGLLDWGGSINSLACAIKCSWKVNTVSPSYMESLSNSANGLEDLIKHEWTKCSGILNGIDHTVWNPETDPNLIKNYSTNNFQSGKKGNKKWLCKKFSLNHNNPLFIFIGRLVHQKSADILPEVFRSALAQFNISILVLGSGIKEIEEQLKVVSENEPSRFHFHSAYDERLSHIMYAGADFLLMPSRAEPCGLNQMYSLKYGTIPVVTSTGGLKDTVIDISEEDGFGFLHEEATVTDIVETIGRASVFYKDNVTLKATRKKIMRIDNSWHASTQKYINLYKSLIQ